jgi:hypothetical protein
MRMRPVLIVSRRGVGCVGCCEYRGVEGVVEGTSAWKWSGGKQTIQRTFMTFSPPSVTTMNKSIIG